MVKFFRIVVRLINLFSHDAFKKQPLKVFFRIFTLTYYLFSKKKKFFKTRARNGDFNFLFKPYRGSGYGGRGQYLYRENYDRFFNVNLGGFQRKFNTFLDIGASRGFFSTYMSKVHNSKIIAVDLFEYAIKDCEENLNLNNDYDGFFRVAAVGSEFDKGKYINLDKSDVPSRTSVLKSKVSNKSSDQAQIIMTSIDEIVKENNHSQIDLIKIDVEGYEYNVLKGGINTIQKYRPIIYLEFKESKLAILNFAKSLKYLIYVPSLSGELIQKNEFLINQNDYENIFLVPREDSINL